MGEKNFGYSLKDILIPTNQYYLKSMINKLESFITRIRWKTYFFRETKRTQLQEI